MNARASVENCWSINKIFPWRWVRMLNSAEETTDFVNLDSLFYALLYMYHNILSMSNDWRFCMIWCDFRLFSPVHVFILRIIVFTKALYINIICWCEDSLFTNDAFISYSNSYWTHLHTQIHTQEPL